MEYTISTKSVLHQFGIGKSYSGYDYILYGIELISNDESYFHCINKVLYVDIASKYHTTNACVERNIRKVIEVIWKDTAQNTSLITQIFGDRFVLERPSNKEFLQLLYEYVKLHTLIDKLLDTEKMICPISKQICIAYKEIVENLISLK